MPGVSRTTVKRRLRDQNVRKWRAANRTMLTEAHIGDRLGWARQYEDVSEDEWVQVCWSDEMSVCKQDGSENV